MWEQGLDWSACTGKKNIHNPLHLSPSKLRQLQWYSSMVDATVSKYAYGVGRWIVLILPSQSKSDLPDPSRPD